MTTMYGARFPQIVKGLFEKVELNMLESMLLEKYLTSDFESLPANLTKLASTILKNKENDMTRRAKKDLEKVLALFDKHEFWSMQPV